MRRTEMFWKTALAFIFLSSHAFSQEPVETAHLEISVYEDAVEIAKEQESRLYLVFKGEGCSWCERQAAEMLKPESIMAMAGLVVCVVDIQERKDLRSKYGVRVVPAHRLLEPRGEIVRSAAGYLNSSGVERFLAP